MSRRLGRVGRAIHILCEAGGYGEEKTQAWPIRRVQRLLSGTLERSYLMSSPRNTSASATRVIKVAIDLVEQQEDRLHAIIESKQATPDEQFVALVELARLAGIVLHDKTETDETPD